MLCEVENEKEVAPVYSSYEGILVKYVCEAGETCAMNKPICIVASEGENWQEAYEKAVAMKNEKKEEFTISRKIVKGGSSGGKMSPKIKKLLRDNKIDPDAIQERYPGEKVTEDLIRQYLSEMNSVSENEPAEKTTKMDENPVLPPDEEGDVRERITSIRRTIAAAMMESCGKTARLTNFLEVDMTSVVKTVNEWKKEGVSISYTAVLIKACATAMKENRGINAMLDEKAGEIVYKKGIHIGCAIDSDAGLVVPVIRDADRKSCRMITDEMRILAQKVRDHALTAEERKGGTFTVSSIGMYDADFFTPIINFPQAAIMGVGRIKTVPRYTDAACTKIEPRSVMEIGLTYDHRIIDGGPAMRYMLTVRDFLEQDGSLLKE